MFVAENDNICTYAQAEETKSIIGDDVTYFQKMDGWAHEDFAYKNGDDFVNKLAEQLVATEASFASAVLAVGSAMITAAIFV